VFFVDFVVLTLLLAFFLTTALPARALAQEEPGPPHASQFTRDDVAAAIEKVKADPNLATERTIKTLEWTRSADSRETRLPAWLAWLGGLFRWFEQSARLLVWVAVAVLAALLVTYLLRIARSHDRPEREDGFVPAPTHVRDLDIRPETLPSDIGSAARALWDRGKHREALALLYRGLLSRLAHVHRVPIRDSTTEGDCLTMAAHHLTTARCEYVTRLVRVWQRSVYGREEVPRDAVYGLCDSFAAALNRDASSGGGVPEGAA
jgi:hypothetical protein